MGHYKRTIVMRWLEAVTLCSVTGSVAAVGRSEPGGGRFGNDRYVIPNSMGGRVVAFAIRNRWSRRITVGLVAVRSPHYRSSPVRTRAGRNPASPPAASFHEPKQQFVIVERLTGGDLSDRETTADGGYERDSPGIGVAAGPRPTSFVRE